MNLPKCNSAKIYRQLIIMYYFNIRSLMEMKVSVSCIICVQMNFQNAAVIAKKYSFKLQKN